MVSASRDRLYQLLPHRPPMLLLDEIAEVSNNCASAFVDVGKDCSFYVEGYGVPAWVAVEYMGQTAALIAGWQLEQGLVEPHVGFLLGTRKLSAAQQWLKAGDRYRVQCQETATVAGNLANFDCRVESMSGSLIVRCKLSVFRKFTPE